jgi:hypothetical protein
MGWRALSRALEAGMRGSISSSADRRRQHTEEGEHASRPERLLCALGADPGFVQAVFGDLAEERAARTAVDGLRSARYWYLREALRSAPHLLASAARGASWRRRAAAILCLGAVAFAATFAVRSMLAHSGAPVRLSSGGDGAYGVIINNVRPVRLSIQVLNAAGRVLPDTGVRYRWLSGMPLPVTSRGVATCTQAGDAVVGASLGRLSTQLVLRCRPVHKVNVSAEVNLVVGDSAVGVPIQAFDAKGKIVSLLRGELSVEDSSVATLAVAADDTRLVHARGPGFTILDIRIGNRYAATGVHVYERASSPEAIRPGQSLAIPVELRGGDMREWHLPAGRENFNVTMLANGDPLHLPRFAIAGANCVQNGTASFMCVALQGASVFVFHSREGDQTRAVRGTLLVWRHSQP